MLVYASLPKVYVTEKGLEKEKEIYVISLASDLHGESNHRPPVVGASNETLTQVSPGIKAALKFFVMATSNVFERIRADQPLSLSGDGIVLYPPADPKGMLALHFAIVESDRGKRDVGKLFEEIFADTSVKKLLSEIAELTGSMGNIPASLLASLFGAVTIVLPAVLKANKDDLLFSHSHSGVDFNDYAGSFDGETYEVGNDRAGAILKIWARD